MRHFALALGRALSAATAALLVGSACAGSGSPADPSGQVLETRTLSNGDTVVFPTSGTRIVAHPESFDPGVQVAVGVEVDPAHLPANAFTERFFEVVTSITVADVDFSGEPIRQPLQVTHPVRVSEISNLVSSNANLKLFFFDTTAGKWVDTGRFGVTDDSRSNVTFAADRFGTYGVFRHQALKVDASASRTIAKAPASISLQAQVTGGIPPYLVIWYFGDDSDPEAGLFVSHFYELPIRYSPSVVVTDQEGTVVSDHIDLHFH